MSDNSIILLATLDTKNNEANDLRKKIISHGVSVKTVDISLRSTGGNLSGDQKIDLMNKMASDCIPRVCNFIDGGSRMIVGMGGGTGSQIMVKIFRKLPMNFPKLLVTTLPFDPRDAVADNSIILVPTQCDIQGLNPMLQGVFERVAALISGIILNEATNEISQIKKRIAITALGITNKGVLCIQELLSRQNLDTIVFHSNGYGGAALIRGIDDDMVDALVDFTPHELTRTQIAGAHVEMPRRFTASIEKNLPLIIVPGGLNFIGLGSYETLSEEHKNRPCFRHSELFTHVSVSPDEMIDQTQYLMECLNAVQTKMHVLVPMEGFSSADREGSELHSPELRQVFLETAKKYACSKVQITEFQDLHIEDKQFAIVCSETILELMNQDCRHEIR